MLTVSTCLDYYSVSDVDDVNIYRMEELEMMMRFRVTRTSNLIKQLWHTDAPLTGSSVLMLAAFATALVGLLIDPRTITGMPAWLKPAKFAISTAIYMVTLAWIFTYLPSWTRLRRLV